MTATVPVNGAALRERLLSAGLSDRTYANRSGVGDSAVRGMLLRNEVNGSVSIADLRRAATEAGMSMGDLFDATATDESDDAPSEDVAVLAQVLNAQKQMHPEDRLAQALGWDVDRLRTAITNLDGRLDEIGLRVHRNSMGVCIRANDKRASHAVTRLTLYKDADDGIAQGTARVLYAAYRGTLSATDTSTDRMMQLGALANRGAVTVSTGVGSRIRLTDDAAFAFEVTR
jgi:transcriptional regulator with XRE-family HTH domain